jgi:hypothetical protein
MFFPSSYNFSFDYLNTIIEALRSESKADWLQNQQGQWNEMFQVPFAEVLTSRGFGFSFNLMNDSDVFRLDQ